MPYCKGRKDLISKSDTGKEIFSFHTDVIFSCRNKFIGEFRYSIVDRVWAKTSVKNRLKYLWKRSFEELKKYEDKEKWSLVDKYRKKGKFYLNKWYVYVSLVKLSTAQQQRVKLSGVFLQTFYL